MKCNRNLVALVEDGGGDDVGGLGVVPHPLVVQLYHYVLCVFVWVVSRVFVCIMLCMFM